MNKKILLFILFFVSMDVNSREIKDNIYINSKNIYYDKITGIINLGKNSLINYQKASISTDEGFIDTENKKIRINGNFYLNYTTENGSDDIMKGNLLKADLDFEEGSAENVNYIFDNQFKINTQTLIKKNNIITFENSFITPCDLEGYFNCPTWSLKVKKTKYNIEDDFFEYFSAFIQIADRKIIYLPYFSHYGTKAERKKGFLRPKTEIINENYGANITMPYYLPINVSTDLKIKPTFYYEKYLSKYFENNIEFKHRMKEGEIKIFFDNFYDNRFTKEIKKGYTLNASGSFNLNKENNINLALNYTSNISKHKSLKDTRAASLDSNITMNSYNLIKNNDLLISKFSGTKSLTGNSNNSNPYEIPSFKYMNYINLKNNLILNNEIKIDLITRRTPLDDLPGKIIRTSLENKFQKNFLFKNKYKIINKLILNNINMTVDAESNSTNVKSGSSFSNTIYYSNEINKIFKINRKSKIKPRAKIIIVANSKENNLNVNDNSKSLSFDYNNIFQENKYFGTDKKENGSRVVLALEQNHELTNNINLGINYGRTYNFDKDDNLIKDIKQNSKLSDHLFEIGLDVKNSKIKYSSRFDKENIELKEDFLTYELKNNKNSLIINKNLTNTNAFISSKSSHFMTAEYTRNINANSTFKYITEIDFEDASNAYKQEYKLQFFDECSTLSFFYKIDNYNDGKQLTPNKIFGLTFEMNFLGGELLR